MVKIPKFSKTFYAIVISVKFWSGFGHFFSKNVYYSSAIAFLKASFYEIQDVFQNLPKRAIFDLKFHSYFVKALPPFRNSAPFSQHFFDELRCCEKGYLRCITFLMSTFKFKVNMDDSVQKTQTFISKKYNNNLFDDPHPF